jgi:hypothetical protein
MLPLEFARISSDGRLTLVIHPGSADVRTYWAASECNTLQEAREDLPMRENTTLTHIAMASGSDKEAAATSNGGIVVFSWLQGRHNVEAAVWTALGSNWEEKRARVFTPDDAAHYLADLERRRAEGPMPYSRACEYIYSNESQARALGDEDRRFSKPLARAKEH